MSLYTMTRSSIRAALHTLCRPEITGLSNVPTEGSFIVASNHLSFLDSIIIQALTPRDVAFFAKAEYFTTPGVKGKLMKNFFESVGSIPVQRGEQAASVAALDSLIDVLDSGSGIGIYPEGTRSPDGRLYRAKLGVAKLALESGAQVIPVAMIDTHKVQPIGRRIPRPGRIGIRIGQPLDFSDRRGQAQDSQVLRQVADEIREAIGQLSGQQYVDVYAPRKR